jgi:hypothetical protein
MLYKETVSKEMWELIQKLMKDEKLKDFVLVGGTALSIKIGHRISVYIDLFTTKSFDAGKMLEYLEKNYNTMKSQHFNNAIFTYINRIKVDLVTHKYPLGKPVEINENIRLISTEDIGAMKLHAIMQSGKRLKDFVDMYFLLEHHPLKNLPGCLRKEIWRKFENGRIRLTPSSGHRYGRKNHVNEKQRK